MPLTGKELIRRLELEGWRLDRIKGSHHVLKKDGKSISVPVHGNQTLPRGTERSIVKKAGLDT